MVIFKEEKNLKEFLSQKEKSIFFVHNKKFVEYLVKFKEIFDQEECVIIPTSVEAIFALDNMNLPYKIPEDYYTPEEKHDYMESIEPRLINSTEKIDKRLQEKYLEIKQSNLRIAFYNLYSFVRVLHPLGDAYFKIKKIIEKENPQRIGLLSEDGNHPITDALSGWLLWEPKENIFQKILTVYQTDLQVHLFLMPKEIEPDKIYFSLKNMAKSTGEIFLRRNPSLYYFLKIFKNDWSFALKVFLNRSKLTPLLLVNAGYNWDLCNKELYKKGYYIWGQLDDELSNWYKKSDKNSQSFKGVLSQLENEPSFRENFQENNIDFYPLVKDKIDLFLEKVSPAALCAYKKTIQEIKKNKIKGALFSVNPTAISKCISIAVQESGFPVIGWQHGDMNYTTIASHVFNDLFTSDLFLSWGKGAHNNLAQISDKLGMKRKIKIVGSSALDKLLSSKSQNPSSVLIKAGINNTVLPLIIYATTLYRLSNTCDVFFPPWSDNYLYKTQKSIIRKLSLLHVTKIVKLHPNQFYALSDIDKYCQSLNEQNVWPVRDSMSAISLFSIADAIITDIPSTTLLQAIACKKPVFCITKHLKLEDEAKKMLGKRVILAEDPESLMEEVKLFIESKIYKADINNTEFLENYGTNPDCQAVKRAVIAVDELIKNKYV